MNNSKKICKIGIGVYRAGDDLPIGLLKLVANWDEYDKSVLFYKVSNSCQIKIDTKQDSSFIEQTYIELKEGEYLCTGTSECYEATMLNYVTVSCVEDK